MAETKALLISNPKTGRYTSRRGPSVEQVCSRLEMLGVAVDLAVTNGPGDATRLASQAARAGVRDIIVSGGDGTINETLQGLIGTKSRLAILPRGTANVLARELKLPLHAMKAAEVIARGKSQRVHVGCATNQRDGARRYFLLMAGIGLDASVVKRVNPKLKKHLGQAAFWLSGLSHLADWQPSPFNIHINGENMEATFVAIGKAASYGGDLAVTPRAQLDQPDFEVCVISSRSRLRYLQLLSYVVRRGMPHDKREVRFLRTTRARANGDAPVQVDGELIGKLPMMFEIAQETIEVVVP
jgi:YegS/Rv2252/BmrU family lipid kinase